MSDELDKAAQDTDVILSAAVQEIRQRAAPTPTAKHCLNCGEKTKNGARWCCVECRDQWQRENEK